MTLTEIKNILECEVLNGDSLDDAEIKTVCGCDLMSDVLSYVKPNALLLTGLIQPQTIRTAEIVDIKTICFVRGKRPDEATMKLAKKKGIRLLVTHSAMFESCGKLYQEGLQGC